MCNKSGSGSGMNNLDHVSESLEAIFWVKILKFFDADPGWKKIRIRDGKVRIRDKHPGSVTLAERRIFPLIQRIGCGILPRSFTSRTRIPSLRTMYWYQQSALLAAASKSSKVLPLLPALRLRAANWLLKKRPLQGRQL
jgi:hypothetical protein